MAAYMKDVAPFLGIAAPERRRALKQAWKSLDHPSSRELGRAATALMALPEREYHYAAYDLIERFRLSADEYFLDGYVTHLLTTKPWWDTVDGLVTAAVSPLCREFDAEWLIDEWSESEDRWLIRAAITHQRGWKRETNIDRILHLCNRHWGNGEFFIAKAIGWALRDIAWLDPAAVEEFLADQVGRNIVAEREALRGLSAQATSKKGSPRARA
jgi:3-methyladenine DNA glycosylase AlkD